MAYPMPQFEHAQTPSDTVCHSGMRRQRFIPVHLDSAPRCVGGIAPDAFIHIAVHPDSAQVACHWSCAGQALLPCIGTTRFNGAR